MQAAVPKSQKIKLEPISSSTIPVGEESTQSLRITATEGVFCPFFCLVLGLTFFL
jgi:AP-1 complex subunit gamma-1